MKQEKFLSQNQLEKRTGCSRKKLYRWRASGLGQPYIQLGFGCGGLGAAMLEFSA